MKILQRSAAALFLWRPTQDTLAAAGAGLVILGLSALMGRLVGSVPLAGILVRDIGMIFAGTCFPLWYIYYRGWQWAEFGFQLSEWKRCLALNLALGGCLAYSAAEPGAGDIR